MRKLGRKGLVGFFAILFYIAVFGIPGPRLGFNIAYAAGQASLYLGPSGGSFVVGSTFTVSVYLNTGNNFVNAVEANLIFPPDKLQVVSPSAGKSLIELWVSQPTYSNSDGTISFRGAIPNPGINTESGIISTVTFRVKSPGAATIKVQDNSRVMLNDGRGTDILGVRSGAVYQLSLPPPAGPLVASPTNPDQERWYPAKSTVFRWDALIGDEGYSYVLNQFPTDLLDDISEGTRDNVVYKDLSDGEYFFHVKRLRGGDWGGVTTYQVRVDNTPPADFEIAISPNARTSRQRPIIDFATTDSGSGVDHYELKIISLDPPKNNLPIERLEENKTPFFIEVHPPYYRVFDWGRYDIIVRAYDKAGNVREVMQRMEIVPLFFEAISGEGVRIYNTYTLPWLMVWIIMAVLILVISKAATLSWRTHRELEEKLGAGAHKHPLVADRLKFLKEKIKEYGTKHHLMAFLLALSLLSGSVDALAASPDPLILGPLEPPIISLFPSYLGNDEIFYIGGRTSVPDSEVLVYIQNTQSGSTVTHSVQSGKSGEWFYSLPQFLGVGKYIVWTQLKSQEELSPPSSRLDLTVAPTAVQFGENRLSYEDLYFILLAIAALVLLGIMTFFLYHVSHVRVKRARLSREIHEAEESVRRGFAALRQDIERELAVVRKANLNKEKLAEARFTEEKLLKDLEAVSGYIGKEVWDIVEAEKDL